jgi:diaminopimelate epimerase
MTCEIVTADPAKNITVLVLSPVPPEERPRLARAILADPSLGAEQAGFVVPSARGAAKGRGALWRGAMKWRLEMMGGEFCGNAARSFGLYLARRTGLSSKVELEVEISGMDRPVAVRVDVERGLAEASMPPALGQRTLDYQGLALPVYLFQGIAHVIAPGIEPSELSFQTIRSLFETDSKNALPDALGVMFWDSSRRFMTPAVYVRGTDTLVFESSCGSGSAALGLHLTQDMDRGEELLPLRQPGGIIEVRVKKRSGDAAAVSIGGPVTLAPPALFSVPE